jgi:hypothetical protein
MLRAMLRVYVVIPCYNDSTVLVTCLRLNGVDRGKDGAGRGEKGREGREGRGKQTSVTL